MLGRRGFLKSLIGGIAAAVTLPAVLDPEKLLWVPGEKLISIPATVESVIYSNEPVTIAMITREAMRALENNLRAVKGINQSYLNLGSVGTGSTVGLLMPVKREPGLILDHSSSIEFSIPAIAIANGHYTMGDIRPVLEEAMEDLANSLRRHENQDVIMVDSPLPTRVDAACIESTNELSLRGMEQYDIVNDRLLFRLDTWYGVKSRK